MARIRQVPGAIVVFLLVALAVSSSGCVRLGMKPQEPNAPGQDVPHLRIGDRYVYEETVPELNLTLEKTIEFKGLETTRSPCFVGERRVLRVTVHEPIPAFDIQRTLFVDAQSRLILSAESTVSGRGPYLHCTLFDYKSYHRHQLGVEAGGWNSLYWTLALAGTRLPVGERLQAPIFEERVFYRMASGPDAAGTFSVEATFPHYAEPERPVGARNLTFHYKQGVALPASLAYHSGGFATEVVLKSYEPGGEFIVFDVGPGTVPVAPVLNARSLPYGSDPELDGGTALLSFRGALRTARASPGYAAYAQLYPDDKVVYAAYEEHGEGPAEGLPGLPQWCIHFSAVRGNRTQDMENHGFRSCIQGQDASSPPVMVVTSETPGVPASPVDIPEEFAKQLGRISVSGLVEQIRRNHTSGVEIRYYGGSSIHRWGSPVEAIVVFVFGEGAQRRQVNYSGVTGQLWMELPAG